MSHPCLRRRGLCTISWRTEFLHKLFGIGRGDYSLLHPSVQSCLSIRLHLELHSAAALFMLKCVNRWEFSPLLLGPFDTPPLCGLGGLFALSFSTSSLSGITRCSGPTLSTSCPSPRIHHFSTDPWFCLLEKGISKQELDTRCAPCYEGREALKDVLIRVATKTNCRSLPRQDPDTSIFKAFSSPKSFLLEGWKGRAIRTHKAAGGIVVAEQALVCVPVIN